MSVDDSSDVVDSVYEPEVKTGKRVTRARNILEPRARVRTQRKLATQGEQADVSSTNRRVAPKTTSVESTPRGARHNVLSATRVAKASRQARQMASQQSRQEIQAPESTVNARFNNAPAKAEPGDALELEDALLDYVDELNDKSVSSISAGFNAIHSGGATVKNKNKAAQPEQKGIGAGGPVANYGLADPSIDEITQGFEAIHTGQPVPAEPVYDLNQIYGNQQQANTGQVPLNAQAMMYGAATEIQAGVEPGKALLDTGAPKRSKFTGRRMRERGASADAKSEAKANKNQQQKDRSKAGPSVGATALLAAKYPAYFANTNDTRTRAESRSFILVATLVLGALIWGWMNWASWGLGYSYDLMYNIGLVGGILMACVLLYALRKRIRLLKRLGNMDIWYYFHLFGGVLGPFLIVFHTNFTLKSVNSAVSLITMLVIVSSGVFGRYIYTRIGYRLHKKLLLMKESEKALLEQLHSYESPLAEKIERRLSAYAMACLVGQKSLVSLPGRLLKIRAASASCYVKAAEDLTDMIKTVAKREAWPPQAYRQQLNKEKDMLRSHIYDVAEISQAHIFERLLVKWRILHIPLLYILVITALFHVLAVHMY